MKRHNSILVSFLVLMISFSLVATGCSFSSGVAQLGKYLPVGVQALETVLSILASSGVINAGSATVVHNDAALAQAAFGDLQSAVNSYQTATGSAKASKLQDIIAALNSTQGFLAKLESDIHLGSPTQQAMVGGLIGVIVTTLSAIEVNIGGNASAAKVARAKAAPLSVKQFKAQFNAILVKGGHAEKQLR